MPKTDFWDEYHLDLPPPQDASPHQDYYLYYLFSRESL